MARTALRNNHEVAHHFANRIGEEGRGSNFYFNSSGIYSYGGHFMIARFLSPGVVAITTRGYSNSTQRHIGYVRHACSHLRVVYCHDPADSAHANMQQARREVSNALALSARKGIRAATRAARYADALHTAESANAYLAAVPESDRGAAQPIDTTNLDGIREEAAAADRAREAVAREAHRQQQADLRQSLDAWRMHAIEIRTGLYSLPPALRLSQDRTRIQTSHGAEIPTEHAPRLWALVNRRRDAGEGWKIGHVPGRVALESAGVYTVTEVRTDGSMRVGCHDIAFAEIEGIARALGYIGSEVAA